jgi:hypothetical protein
MTTTTIYLVNILGSFIIGIVTMIIIHKLSKKNKKERPVEDEGMILELISKYPNRKELNNLYWSYQYLLTFAGLGVAVFVQTLSNIWLPVWLGCILFSFIFIYVSIIAFLAKRKIMNWYDTYIAKANKLLNQIK